MALITYKKSYYGTNETSHNSRRLFDTSETGNGYYDILWCSLLSSFVTVGYDQPLPGYEIRDRSRSEYFIHFVVSGKGTMNGQPFEAGSFFCHDLNQVHTMIADNEDPWRLYWISLSGNFVTQARKNLEMYETQKIYPFPHYEDIIPIFKHALYAYHPQSKNTDYIVSLVNMIFACIDRNPEPQMTDGNTSYARQIAYKAKLYMEREFATVTVENVAQKFHMDRKYLSKIFKKVYEISPQEYLINLRVSVAQSNIINTDLPLTEIASLVGYDNYNSFIYSFKNITSFTPSEYLKKYRKPVI